MSISAQFLPHKILAHFHKSDHLGQLFVTPEMIAKKFKKM